MPYYWLYRLINNAEEVTKLAESYICNYLCGNQLFYAHVKAITHIVVLVLQINVLFNFMHKKT